MDGSVAGAGSERYHGKWSCVLSVLHGLDETTEECSKLFLGEVRASFVVLTIILLLGEEPEQGRQNSLGQNGDHHCAFLVTVILSL